MDAAGNTLYLVNAGSDTISVFDLSKKEPNLIQIISSGGTFPNSVAVSGNLLYVLNAGGAHGAVDIITGFTVDAKGKPPPRWRIRRGRSAGRLKVLSRPGQLFPERQLDRRDREERQ